MVVFGRDRIFLFVLLIFCRALLQDAAGTDCRETRQLLVQDRIFS